MTAIDGDALPQGWEVAKIGDRFNSWGGHTPSKANAAYWGPGLPWVSSQDVKTTRLTSSTHSVTEQAVAETRLRVCPVGSVLVVVRSGILAHTLPVSVTEVPVAINQDLKAFYSKEPYLNEWLALFLRMSAQRLLASSRRDGTTVQSIQYPLLKNTMISIPPVDDRQPIIRFAEHILTKQSAVSPHLAAARRAIERLRQAVLVAACSGRLTADWRDAHQGIDPVNLNQARQRRLREHGRRFREPQPNPHAPITDLPEGWVAGPLGLVVRELKYGTSKRSEYGAEGTPVLRIPNVSGESLDITDLKSATLGSNEAESLQLSLGDLLMIRSNGSVQLVGKTLPVTEQAAGMAFAGYLMRLRTDLSALLPAYLSLALASPWLRHQIEMPARSTSGVNNINTDEVRGLVVSIPPVEEQHEIVLRVSALINVASTLRTHLEAAHRRVERSSQAVLAKAFRGELSTDVEVEADV